MTLIKHEGKMQITCDACPATYRRTYAEEDFKILLQDIKDEQWKIERKADAWTHTCPDCWKWADRRLF
jgi:hypothetical protein